MGSDVDDNDDDGDDATGDEVDDDCDGGGALIKKILVNHFPPFFSPHLNLWSSRRTHFFLFWQASRLFQKKDKSPEAH